MENMEEIKYDETSLKEVDMEYLVAKYPEHFIGDKGLSLKGQQVAFHNSRFDLLFEDRTGAFLIVELQMGVLDKYHHYRMKDYKQDLREKYPNADVELLVIANEITQDRKKRLKNDDIDFIEVPMSDLWQFAVNNEEVSNLPSFMGINSMNSSVSDFENIVNTHFYGDTHTPLIDVIMAEDYEKARCMIEAKEGIHERYFSGCDTPLHFAVKQRHINTVKLLILNGAEIDSVNERFETPLYCAVEENLGKTAQYLIKVGANINLRDKKGRTLFHNALYNGKYDIAKRLLILGASPNSKDAEKGYTPLHGIVLVVHHPSFNSEYDLIELMELMIKKGANVNAKNINGDTPFSLSFGNLKLMMLMITKADVNLSDNRGMTMLYRSVLEKNWSITKLLIENGANPNIKNEDFCFPIELAYLQKRYDVVEYLKDNGADVNFIYSCSYPQEEPFITKIMKDKNYDLFKSIVQKGASLSIQAKETGYTPLHAAVVTRKPLDIIVYLIQHGANVNARDEQDGTPLHSAILFKNYDAMKILLLNGADINAYSKHYKATPLQYARGDNTAMSIMSWHGIKSIWPFGKNKRR